MSKEKTLRKVIGLKEQYETEILSLEAKLTAVDDFLSTYPKEKQLVLEKIAKEKQLVEEEENKPFCKLDFSYTKSEFIDTLRSSVDMEDFERIKPNISEFVDYFMREIDCSSIYVSIIGSMNILADYFLENLLNTSEIQEG